MKHLSRKSLIKAGVIGVAGVLAVGTGALIYAEGGSGNSSAGNEGGAGAGAGVRWVYNDDYGTLNGDTAHDSQLVTNVIQANGDKVGTYKSYSGPARIQEAITNAYNTCIARNKAAGIENPSCRLVSVGWVGADGAYAGQSGDWHYTQWIAKWSAATSGKTFSHKGIEYDVNTQFANSNNSLDTLAKTIFQGTTPETTSIVVIALGDTEPVGSEPPAPPSKDIEKGISADSMTNRTTIKTETGTGGKTLTIRDTITPNGVQFTTGNYRVIDETDNNKDITSEFDFTTDSNGTVVNAVHKGNTLPDKHTWAFSLDVTVQTPGEKTVQDVGSTIWDDGAGTTRTQSTPRKEFNTWSPKPDKSWVKYVDGKWQSVIDPQHTNTTGGDNAYYVQGDTIGSVVNATVEKNLIQAPQVFSITDDYKNADYFVDTQDASTFRVYSSDAETASQSSVADIVNNGTDVTDMFTITTDGTKVTATAKPEMLSQLKGMAKAKQFTLLVPMTVNFDPVQAKSDYGVKADDELKTCTNPTQGTGAGTGDLTNAGSETVNNETLKTNEPKICIFIPKVHKDVVATSSQNGGQEDINGKTVYPGQKVEYVLDTTNTLPDTLAYDIESAGISDTYDKYLTPDRQTLELTDLATGRIIPKSQYTTKWNDSEHKFTVMFTSDYVKANWAKGKTPKIILRFEGTVDKNAPADHVLENTGTLLINNSITPSNKVTNKPPTEKPTKEDTKEDKTISIDGKDLMLGDKTFYRVNLNASNLTEKTTAYKIQRLGLVDDYDEKYLNLDEKGIQVVDSSGNNVTDKFNIQVKDGVVYAFFKTVDTVNNEGDTIKGDPQPSDLSTYSTETLDPLHSAYIDQSVLGQDYTLILPMTVSKVDDGYVVKNTATQITNDHSTTTNTVTNPLKVINPKKDVTVDVDGKSVNNGEIKLNSTFNYRLDSSVLPADRAYNETTDWSIKDDYDETHDHYTGNWVIEAQTDIYDNDGNVLYKKGQVIDSSELQAQADKATTDKTSGDVTVASNESESREANSATDKASAHKKLFNVYDKDGVLTVEATSDYITIANYPKNKTSAQGWSVYAQFLRYATGDVENEFTETYNGTERKSNKVITHTVVTPAIDIVKWDKKSGKTDGDRNQESQALNMDSDSTTIEFTITNTGDEDLKDVSMKDVTVKGSGTVKDIKYPDGFNGVLKVGESITVEGTLTNVKSGDLHTDTATVTGTGVYSNKKVSDKDDWNGKRTGGFAETGVDSIALAVAGAIALALGTVAVGVRRKTMNK